MSTASILLKVDQKVLCRIGYYWIPGVIVSVQEHLHDADNDLVLPLAGAPPAALQLIQHDDDDDNDNNDADIMDDNIDDDMDVDNEDEDGNDDDMDFFDPNENEEDFPRLQPGSVVPYRVALKTVDSIVMPGGGGENNNDNSEQRSQQRIASIAATGKWFIRKLTGQSVIMRAAEGDMFYDDWKTSLTEWLNDTEEFDSDEKVVDEAKRLVKLCASMRFVEGAVHIAAALKSKSMILPLHAMGHALWKLFISGHESIIHTAFPEERNVQLDIRQAYSNMSEWLSRECGITDSHLARHYAGDDDENKSLHAEHVVAINGDVMMLFWLINNKYAYCRRACDRPMPRNVGVLHELLQESVTDTTKEKAAINKRSFLPRDDDGWTPLHHAAACGNFNIIDAYRIKGEEQSSFIRLNHWFPLVDEFHAKTLSGQTALDLVADDDDPTRQSLLKLEKRLYQGMLNDAIGNGRLPAGFTDFAQLESLVDEYGLDVHEAVMWDEDNDLIYQGGDGMTVALESGNPIHVQFLARLLGLKDLKTWRNKDGKGMLHVAAGHKASWQSKVRNDDARLREDEQQQALHAQCQQDKLSFMEHIWNRHGNATFYSEGIEYAEKSHFCWFRSTLEMYERQCEKTSDTESKIQLLQWLIQQQGFALPEYDFIIHNCDFHIAQFLLEYRLNTDSFLNDQFQDKAPLAMVGVKQFLYCTAQDAGLTASDVALLCVQRPAYDELLCITDACRLLLLDWLHSKGYVDLVKIRTPSGDSILHEAVCNKETVIAVWLARKFPRLAHTRSSTASGGQLPVHVSLKRVTNEDDCVEKAICKFMIQYAGEGRGPDAWSVDKRAWALEDSNGWTVQDYAMCCCIKEVRTEALKSGRQKAFRQMLQMALDEASSVQSFQTHVERNYLEGFKFGHDEEIQFIYACISLGRLDVLQWYEHVFCHNVDHRLARHLSSEKPDNKWLPCVFCAPSEKFSVGDCLEVLGRRCRGKEGVDFDGTWMLYGWDLFSNRTHVVKIENGVCLTELPSLEGATLEECTNSQDSLQLLLHANDEDEYWYSTNVHQSIEGAIGMICFKRKAARYYNDEFWVDNGREIVLVKMGRPTTGDAGETFIWQKARVIASNNKDLTIEFYKADPPRQEMIPQDSSRINRTGIYKLDYLCGTYASLVFHGPKEGEGELVLMTGLDLARRHGHENIVQWIEEEVSCETLKSDLRDKERQFFDHFFSNAPSHDLNRIIQETRMVAFSTGLSDKGELVVSQLKDELYVLGHCWTSQPPLSYYGENGGYDFREHNELGLLRCAARLGRLDRVEWVIGHGFDPSSDVATSALFDAARGNHVHVLEFLLSKGVDGSRSHVFIARGSVNVPGLLGLGPLVTNYTLLELAVERLSGDVVSFLIGHGHVPADQDLLGKAVRPVYLLPNEVSMKNRMAADRLPILKQLVQSGLVLADSATEVMSEALCSFMRSLDKMEMVPIMRELICWLCAQGCDLAYAVKRDYRFDAGDGIPGMLAELVLLSETVWPVADAISRGLPFDEIEHLLQQSGTSSNNIHSIRDPLGRTLVQVAVISNQAQHLEWLVTVKGANIIDDDDDDDDEQNSSSENGLTLIDLARQKNLQNMVSTITRLRQLQPTSK